MDIKVLTDRIYGNFITSFKNAITPLKQSFFEILAKSQSSTFQLLYIYLDRILNDSFVTACSEGRVLSYFAPLKNIARKEPTRSTGIIKFTGADTSLVPSGTKVIYNELEFQTIEDGTIDSGFVNINSISSKKGTVNNTLPNVDMFLITSIIGVDNKAISVLGFSGGIDQETIESVRTRTRQKFAIAPQIDNDNFYRSLANEVDNVKASFISDNIAGNGSFGVTILTFSNDGIPVQSDIDEVEQHFIDNKAFPSYAEEVFFLPIIVYQDFTILLAINDEASQTATEQLLRDYLYLFQKPSTTFQFSPLSEFLQENGARLISPDPASDLAVSEQEVIDLGTITWA